MSRYFDTFPPSSVGRFWLVGALLLVLLPHLWRFPLWLSTGCIALIAWRLLHELRGWSLPGRGVRWLLTLLGIGSVVLVFHSIIGRDAGVALLAVMLCLKLIEIHTQRDAMIALFIGYFLVISGFLFSQSLFMGTYLFAVVLVLTAALTALNHHGVGVAQHRLYLRTGGALLLQALPLMVIMFILFPRLSAPLWSMPKESNRAITGLSNSISMGSISQLAESDEVAFRVLFEGTIPAADKLYWRGPVLWHTDGSNWQRRPFDSSHSSFDYQFLDYPVRYTVTLEPHDDHWLFALDLPASLPHKDIPGGVVLSADYQLLGRRQIHTRIRYSVSSVLSYRIKDLPEWLRQEALQLPSESNPRTRTLAAQWRETATTDRDLLQVSLRYFSEQPFYYSRTPPELADNPVDAFLFDTREGFCEHFASAFVTLMRAAGIPARVVTGYQGGELNKLGQYLIIRQRNAHAWAEIWLDEEGWIRIDPTALIPPERVNTSIDVTRFRTTDISNASGGAISPLTQSLLKLRQSWDAINNSWNQWVLGFDRERQIRLLKLLGLQSFSWKHLISLMMVLLFSSILLITLFLLMNHPRQRDPVLQLYQRFCRKLERSGIKRRPDEGPRAFASRVIAHRADLAEKVQAITSLYESLRYGKGSDKAQQSELKRQVAEFRC